MESNKEFPQKTKNSTTSDTTLGIYLKEHTSNYGRVTCKPMFIETLFTIAKLWNDSLQLKN
jgi:hypothetical protein